MHLSIPSFSKVLGHALFELNLFNKDRFKDQFGPVMIKMAQFQLK